MISFHLSVIIAMSDANHEHISWPAATEGMNWTSLMHICLLGYIHGASSNLYYRQNDLHFDKLIFLWKKITSSSFALYVLGEKRADNRLKETDWI